MVMMSPFLTWMPWLAVLMLEATNTTGGELEDIGGQHRAARAFRDPVRYDVLEKETRVPLTKSSIQSKAKQSMAKKKTKNTRQARNKDKDGRAKRESCDTNMAWGEKNKPGSSFILSSAFNLESCRLWTARPYAMYRFVDPFLVCSLQIITHVFIFWPNFKAGDYRAMTFRIIGVNFSLYFPLESLIRLVIVREQGNHVR